MRYLYLFIIEALILASFNSCILNETAEPVTISGTITNSSGIGIPQVAIEIDASSEKISTITGTDGTYSITVPTGGTAIITLSKEGYTTRTKHIAFGMGDHKIFNLKMNTLIQDSYFKVDMTEASVKKMKGEVYASITTNIDFDFDCKEDWIKCTKYKNGITIIYDTNYSFEERSATVTLTSEYENIQTIKITQEAGPPFELKNYIGKDNNSDFSTTVPFITLSNDAKLTSVSSSYEGLDLTTENSPDKRTIYFPNIKVPTFTPVTISYTVESPTKEKLDGQFELKAFINSTSTTSNTAQKVLFTKDSKYCWVYTYVSGSSTLIQYSSSDLSVSGNIPWNQSTYSTVSYNRYNNCLYISKKNQSKVDVYNATTGQFIKELDLSSSLNGNSISDIEFAENGYGLTFVNNLLYYIDSADNNKCGVFSNDPSLYNPSDPNKLIVKTIATCNNGKTFVLTDKSAEINNVFTIDAYSKKMTSYYNLRDYYYATSNSYPGVLLGSSKDVTYIDFSTGLRRDIISNYTGNRGSILLNGEQYPTVLTSVLSTISIENGQQKKFELNKNGATSVSNIYSSNNGDVLVIVYSNKIYLFSTEIFTKNSNKLK